MTIHAPNLAAALSPDGAPAASPDAAPDRAEAAAALATLRAWAEVAPDAERAALLDAIGRDAPGRDAQGAAPAPYPTFARSYPQGFEADAAYRATLPDLQNGPASLIRGARTRIQHVGIAGFRLPLTVARPDGAPVTLEAEVTGTVSLEADAKGINMSRIMRSFYAQAEHHAGLDVAEAVLDAYRRDLGGLDARLMLRLSYPMRQRALRSGLSGWQHYDMAFEVAERDGGRLRALHLDYVYSSTCPCSLELSEHARATRGQLATPHSQRSVARLSVALTGGLDAIADPLHIEDLVALARAAVPTETQVMVKREDEQAFAELNAANPIFVEDAARLFAEALRSDPRIGDFRVAASHQESLHSHDAVSVLTEGETFAAATLEPHLFPSLVHRR